MPGKCDRLGQLVCRTLRAYWGHWGTCQECLQSGPGVFGVLLDGLLGWPSQVIYTEILVKVQSASASTVRPITYMRQDEEKVFLCRLAHLLDHVLIPREDSLARVRALLHDGVVTNLTVTAHLQRHLHSLPFLFLQTQRHLMLRCVRTITWAARFGGGVRSADLSPEAHRVLCDMNLRVGTAVTEILRSTRHEARRDTLTVGRGAARRRRRSPRGLLLFLLRAEATPIRQCRSMHTFDIPRSRSDRVAPIQRQAAQIRQHD